VSGAQRCNDKESILVISPFKTQMHHLKLQFQCVNKIVEQIKKEIAQQKRGLCCIHKGIEKNKKQDSPKTG
jgi:hypothetical protein